MKDQDVWLTSNAPGGREEPPRTCTRRIGGRGRLGLDGVEHGVAIVVAQVSQLGDALL